MFVPLKSIHNDSLKPCFPAPLQAKDTQTSQIPQGTIRSSQRHENLKMTKQRLMAAQYVNMRRFSPG